MPPNPIFALRTAARSLGSLPERYGLKGVLVWCPESLFGVARARCPTEGCSESLVHYGWYGAKLISDLDDSFYWWPRKLKCASCCSKGLHCTYSAADAKILDQYDPFVKDQLERSITFVPPAHDATRNSFVGISRRVHELLIRGATCESIRAVRQMITEMAANRHHAGALSYYLYEDWDRKHPSEHISFEVRGSDTNRKLLPFLEYDECVAAPHESTLRSLVCSYYSQIRTFLRKRMLMLRGDVLRGDATFKVPSKVRCVLALNYNPRSLPCTVFGHCVCVCARTRTRVRRALRRVAGSKVLYGLYTVMDEYMRVQDQAPMFDDDGGSDLTRIGPMLADMSKRYAIEPFKLWYKDNCCMEVGDLLKYFPWLKGETRSSTHAPVLLDGVRVIYVSDLAACESSCADLKAELEQSDDPAIGFDMEWFFVAVNGKQRRTGLIQLATRSNVLLIHVAKFIAPSARELPPNLMRILSSQAISKCGVMIEGDRKKLLRDFPGIENDQLLGFVELGDLANEVCTARRSRWNMGDLSILCLKKDVPKPNYLRLSNWDEDLSSDQREYAARDAVAGFDIYRQLKSVAGGPLAVGVLPTVLEGAAAHGAVGGGGEDTINADNADDGDEIGAGDEAGGGASSAHFEAGGDVRADAADDDDDAESPIRVDDDDDGDGGAESASERLKKAERISNFGLSGWLERDPTRNQKFNLRLRAERAKKRVSRVKLDAFHWFQRISNTTPKQHILLNLFMACLRDAVFYLDPREVDRYRDAKVAEGMSREEADKLPKSYFIKYGKCVRIIPSRIELAIRVQSVIEIFDGLADADGNVLLTPKSKKQLQSNMEHIWLDCLSDPDGVNMYYDISKSDGGAPHLATIRGTSQLEGYHKQIRYQNDQLCYECG